MHASFPPNLKAPRWEPRYLWGVELSLIGQREVPTQGVSNSGVDTFSLILRIRLASGNTLASAHTLKSWQHVIIKQLRREEMLGRGKKDTKTFTTGGEMYKVTHQSVVCSTWQISSVWDTVRAAFQQKCSRPSAAFLPRLQLAFIYVHQLKASLIGLFQSTWCRWWCFKPAEN